MTAPRSNSRTLHGIGLSQGVVIAKAWTRLHIASLIPDRTILPEELPREQERLRKALLETKTKLESLRDELQQSLGKEHSQIIDFHIQLLSDTELYEGILDHLTKDHCCAEKAIQAAVLDACSPLESSGKPFFMERAADIRDVGARLLNYLMQAQERPDTFRHPEPVILVCQELPASMAAHLAEKNIAAVITASGSRTSHSAILAQSLGIPALFAVQETLENIEDGMLIALDSTEGTAVVSPNEATLQNYTRRQELLAKRLQELADAASLPAETLDGYRARLVINVALPAEALQAKTIHQTGIGLFRTECLFLEKGRSLSEEEQYQIYSQTVKNVYPYSCIFRTLDIGGDKPVEQMLIPQETNPFMGMRAIRYSLRHPDHFRAQLRAILRTTTLGKIRIMFPMISAQEELDKALLLLDEAKLELTRKKIDFNEDFDIGCMIEVPSAVQIADRLIHKVDFFSIGTNDLTQYTLAVDRSNPELAHLYQPAHPAILRQIKRVADITYENGKWVSICGEMAGEPLYTPLVLGMGIHELSMSPNSLPTIRNVIRNIRVFEAEELLQKALECHDGAAVNQLCRDFLLQNHIDILN